MILVCGDAPRRRFDYLVLMRVAVFRTPDVSAEGFAQLMNSMQGLPGPIQFESPGEGGEGSEVSGWGTMQSTQCISWEEAFAKMSSLRRKHALPEDCGVVLIDRNAQRLQLLCLRGVRGLRARAITAVHTGDWEEYTGSNFVYPSLAHHREQPFARVVVQLHGGVDGDRARRCKGLCFRFLQRKKGDCETSAHSRYMSGLPRSIQFSHCRMASSRQAISTSAWTSLNWLERICSFTSASARCLLGAPSR